MKYVATAFTLALSLLFASASFAMNEVQQQYEQNIQQKIKEAPEMSKYCVARLDYLKRKIKKYEDLLKQEEKSWYKAKLNYYKQEYKDWVGYCTPKEDDK